MGHQFITDPEPLCNARYSVVNNRDKVKVGRPVHGNGFDAWGCTGFLSKPCSGTSVPAIHLDDVMAGNINLSTKNSSNIAGPYNDYTHNIFWYSCLCR